MNDFESSRERADIELNRAFVIARHRRAFSFTGLELIYFTLVIPRHPLSTLLPRKIRQLIAQKDSPQLLARRGRGRGTQSISSGGNYSKVLEMPSDVTSRRS